MAAKHAQQALFSAPQHSATVTGAGASSWTAPGSSAKNGDQDQHQHQGQHHNRPGAV
ncbi:uncharacterized protein BKCO1_1000260 [Diplodia corticola]|uniref:Uncharacterized protein n=1 Tax=Diplodia corticola TaxID=236234 RepID=A0A1J9RGT6_9PEZI|nr:uncharacterized protein BKCO1_1000260 [Diplodia corticola]OJD40758.1 hypothetical protein BKCO1_1000260 [Diplodia corticola]